MDYAVDEVPVSFTCQGIDLIGVLHVPASPPRVGVLIVVGGPQYRVGSHRQFVLLARDLASHGVGVLRFDCRGMGDSDGDFPGFERIEPDIAAAVALMERRFSSIRHLILWGLCDATSGICKHSRRDPRVSGIVLVNPWVRTEAGFARTQLKHYYLNRLMESALFRKVLRGEFKPLASIQELFGNIRLGLRRSARMGATHRNGTLAENMAEDLRRYRGRILLIISGRDLTAREFDDSARRSKTWRVLLSDPRLTRRDLPEADHTFSRREWKAMVSGCTWEWIKALE